jgi:hypothetical protein
MRIAADTSPEADAFQIEVYRKMGGAERVQAMFRLGEMARGAAAAGIRARHPGYDATQLKLALARLRYGDDLVARTWPDHELVDP